MTDEQKQDCLIKFLIANPQPKGFGDFPPYFNPDELKRLLHDLTIRGFVCHEIVDFGDGVSAPVYSVTQKGVTALKQGGLWALKNKEDALHDLEAEKLRREIKHLNWLLKTRWWPLVISVLGFVLAFIAIYLQSQSPK